tara:strand:- start:593 stop:817 length:225 start_codon:yes stop_codon:yes gene_type:complete
VGLQIQSTFWWLDKARVRSPSRDAAATYFGVNWSEILQKGGVPEPPGYIETVAKVRSKPKRTKRAKLAKRKKLA